MRTPQKLMLRWQQPSSHYLDLNVDMQKKRK